MKTAKLFLACVGALAVLGLSWGCGGKSRLSRSEAKDLINKSPEFTDDIYDVSLFSEDRVQDGVRQGLWRVERGFRSRTLVLTAEGEKYFEGEKLFDWQEHPIIRGNRGNLKVKRQVVEVTGIADEAVVPPGAIKRVEFIWKWNWDSVPDVVKRIARPRLEPEEFYYGLATLQLYDDGWRVTSVDPARGHWARRRRIRH